MNYREFLKSVKYTSRHIFVPILSQNILRSSFIKNGKYSKEAEMKFLKAVYDKREFRKQREEQESIVLEGLKGSERQKK